MSWGTELWDQFDNLSTHAQKGINFCERYSSFTKDRIELEYDYASKLKKLVKNYQPKKKERDEENEFTVARGFLAMLKELHDMAGQHEVIAENLNNGVVKALSTFLQELKQDRKKCYQEESKYQNTLQHSLQQLEKSKRSYERAFRDAEKGVDAFKRADADQNLSRADVEKAKNSMNSKMQYCEHCKKEYASELQKTNETQHSHYYTHMPQLLQQMEDVDRRRITKTSELLTYCAQVERDVIPIVNTCIDGIKAAGSQVNADQDVRIVVEKYKSGFVIPTEHEFEDLGDPGNPNSQAPPAHSTPRTVQRAETMKGTQSGGKAKSRKGLFGIFSSSKDFAMDLIGAVGGNLHGADSKLEQVEETREDFSHLPPQQQKKRLQEQIEKVHERIKNKTSERDGLQKLKDVYVQNSSMGDPQTVDKDLEKNAKELDMLQQTLTKYQTYLADAGQNQVESHNSVQRKLSTRSAGSSNTGSNPGTPVQMRSHTAQSGRVSPDSGVDNSTVNQQQSYNDDDSFEATEDDEFRVIGTATAMYSFDAPNDGSIPITEGEVLHVIEQDLGDGWTRVRKHNGDEGFVPTSYMQIALDSGA